MKSPLDYRCLYGLIGNPLTHSFSRDFFNSKFLAEGIDARYLNFEIQDVAQLLELVDNHPNLMGLNVTSPFKQQVIPLLDGLDDQALAVGAVNVISIRRDPSTGRVTGMRGHNTDVAGFDGTIADLDTARFPRAMVLGTGGAAKAVRAALQGRGIDVQLVSRHKTGQVLVYDEITRAMVAAHPLIVNATPLGKYPDVDLCPDFPYRFLTPHHLCYDLIYNPEQTLFMRQSAQHGAATRNGLEMLLLQAFLSFDIWTHGSQA